tara:strand:+ start:4795 stop:8268 length:3474 start_codon:yes stop_codon:yes gene_type:complete
MTIKYDPHQNIDGNVQLDERHTINVSQPFRVVVPTHAPFYYSSLVVKHNGNVLTENVHYYVSHRYGTGTHQTAQLCYGSIWMIDKRLGGDITVDYHPMGINEATAEQITAERLRNADETPTDLDWEEIVGEKYFPPVNILFDRDNWNGETEIINSINALGEAISGGGWPYAKEGSTYPNFKVDPNAINIAPEENWTTISAVFCVKKTLTFKGGLVNVDLFVDNYADFYVDGDLKFQSVYPTASSEQIHIPAGEHTIAVIVRNGSGPSYTNFKIQEVGQTAQFSDRTWRCAVLGEELTEEDAVRPIGGNGDVYGFIEDWYKAVKVVFETAPAHNHVTNISNPHGDEYGWIHALERDGVAKNATKIFNKTLAELTAYVNSRAPTTADFSGKVRRTGDLLLGKMVMQNGFGVITKRNGIDHLLKIVNGSVEFTSLSDVVVTSGKTTNQPVHLKAGKNVLSLYPDGRGLTYNGHEVLSKDTVAPHVPTADDAASGIESRSTVTVTMTGKGTSGDKLVIEWNVPDPTDAVYAMRPLATSFGSSKTHGAVPNLVKQVADIIPTKLTIANARINGKRLTNSIFLNPIDFGLDEVANISDKDLPISTAQQNHLDQYVTGAHEHKLSDFGYGHATKSAKGVTTLQPIGSSVSESLRSQDVRAEKDRLPDISDAIDNLMPAGVITILRYGESGNADVTDITTSGYIFTISQPKKYYCNGLHTIPATSLNLAELFPAMAEEQMIYLYANYIDGAASYEVYDYQKAEDDTLTEIGHILCNETGIDSYQVRNVTRLGKFRELDEHRQNESAHAEKPSDRNDLGLGSFVNAEMRFNVARPTFQQIFDTWDRFSHGAKGTSAGHHAGRGDVQPSNVLEEQSWTYNQATDAVVQPVNTGSFCGFISPTKHEKYLFDTILQSAAADNDVIGVVLGFVVDESGRERTLAWNGGQDGRFGSAVGSALCVDYNQSSQIITPVKPTARLPGNHNWNSTGPRRVKITRDGDNYTVEQYTPNDTETIEETFHFNIQTGDWSSYVGGVKVQEATLDAATVASMAKFRGAQPFGYCCQSQPGSTYVNIQRPDEDGQNFYASVPEQIEAVSPLGLIRIFKGRSTGLSGKRRADFIAALPAPVIKNYLGETIAVPPERITYHVFGDMWTMVCHLDATMLTNNPL